MSANPEQAQQAPAARPHPNLIRPEELQKATFLDDATRTKYTMAFRQFWNFVEQKPPGSPEHTQALAKLTEWSQKLRSLATQHRIRLQQQAKQAQQQNQQNQESQAGAASGSQPAAAPNAQPNQAQQQHVQQAGQQQQSQQPQSGQPPNQQPRPNQPQISPAILQHVQQFQYALPPQIQLGTAEAEAKIKEMRHSYTLSLAKQEYAAQQIKRFNQLIEQRRKDGQDFTEIQVSKSQQEIAYNNMKQFVDDFRKKQQTFRDMAKNNKQQQQPPQQQTQQPQPQQPAHQQQQQQQPAQQQQPQQPKPQTQQSQQQPQPQPQQQQKQAPAQAQTQAPSAAAAAAGATMQGAVSTGGATTTAGGAITAGGPQVKTEGGAGAVGAPQASTGQTQVQPPQLPNAQMQNQNNAGRPTQSPATTQPQMASQFASSTAAQQVPQPNGVQTAVRPPQLPGQAPGAMNQIGQMQHGSPATTQAPSGGPIPLTHHAAVTAAAQSHTNRTGTPQQAATFRTTPHENPNTLNNPKMPIPKQLTVPPPQPVTMGPARPTLGGPSNGAPGMMGQPVINKLPTYMLEGEGDRVLSKKKLDELVRQVTGGGEGTPGESLTPEVEEAMLQLADDFVDNVISSACKLSKLRDSQQLDIRDIQLVLERNYNIRIPGYASDEIRTVRKLHPTSAWNEKMKALQAAKIMGGKTDL